MKTPQLHKHLERIATSGLAVIPYSPRDPLGDHYKLLRDRVDRMVQSGYAVYLDEEHARWKYSAKGALVLSFRMVLRGYRRYMVPDKTRAR